MVTIKKAITSGIMIAMGVFAFLSCDVKYVGAFLFSLGLFCVCEYKLNLFTGMIGYAVENTKANGSKAILDLLKVLLFNIIGIAGTCVFLSFTAGQDVIDKATNIVETSVTLNLMQLLIKSIMCGIIMLIAVDRYKNCNGMAKYIAVFVGIPVFILSGYYHSIAYVGYLTLGICGGNLSSNVTAPKIIVVILLAVIGNAIGSILMRFLTTSKTSE
ncbi:MAG: formate/nitrite transporter family protein [Ruminococcus sp.]|nr:formate/nitrite transporter family protein [Ruminococcus sp.]